MKRLLMLMTVGVLAFGMTACGNGEDGTVPTSEQAQETENQTVTTDEAQTENTEATEDTEVTDDAAGSVEGMGAWSDEMTALRQVVVDTLGEDYWPNMPVDPEILEMVFGITSDMYDDYMAEMPMISTNVDTLLIIKAKDDKVEAVEAALNNYRDMLVSDTMQYPTNLGKIQASRIQRYGNYVCFVQLGAGNLADENMTEEDSLLKCQEQNELALEVIGKNIPQ